MHLRVDSDIRLVLYVYFFSFTACLLPSPHVEYLVSCTGKALTDEKLATTVRVDMEERLDAPNLCRDHTLMLFV